MAVPEPFPFRVSDTMGKGTAHFLNHKIFKKSLTGARDLPQLFWYKSDLIYFVVIPSFIEKKKKNGPQGDKLWESGLQSLRYLQVW